MTKAGKTKSRGIPITQQMVKRAYRKVKSNKGSAGVDQISLEEFQKEEEKHLYKIWNRLSSGSYFAPPVREVEIAKKDGKKRKLGIPTVGDRIAQQVVKGYLEPRLEQVFHEDSYGYRPEKSAHQALDKVRSNVRVYGWVLDMDIKSFFDEVDHELVMKALSRHVDEPWVLLYVKRWLEAPVEDIQGDLRYRKGSGTPQGGVISPLLANLFLHYVLDQWLTIYSRDVPFVRYADDVIIHCKSEREAQQILQSVKARMAACKLRLHEGKTKIVYCQDYSRTKKAYNKQFDFLGFSFRPRSKKSKRAEGRMFLGYDCAVSIASRKRILSKIRSMAFHRWSTLTIEEVAKRLNPSLRGWVNYYGRYGKKELLKIFRVINFRLVKWVINRYKSLKGSIKKAYGYLKQLQKGVPKMFYHWQKGFLTL